MNRRLAMSAAAFATSTAVIAAFTLPAASAAPAQTAASPDGTSATASVPPGMLAALERDLGLTPDEARARMARENHASKVLFQVRKDLGSDFGGAWLTDDASALVVATTDASTADQIRAAGAVPRVVDRSQGQLDAIKARLDRAAQRAPSTVPGWYVDEAANTVVVLSRANATDAARAFVTGSGVDASAVRFVASDESPRPFYDVRGGDAYYIENSARCSVGFSVERGFVTAGHCGDRGDSTSGYNRVAQGTFQDSSFPGNDYGWVAVNSNWTPRGVVNGYNSGIKEVAGSQEAPVGAQVCRSGSTTGWHCGQITARNATVTYPQGSVFGLIRTTVCAEPGDSGGSLLSLTNHAQGVTSGGSGNCSSGGTTFFQPVNEILSVYGLTLLTGDGGNEPPGGCDDAEQNFNGSLSSGAYDIHPNGRYYYSSSSGTHFGCLDGPSSGDFDLYLQKWNGGWFTVARSISPGPDEEVNYNGTAGYYRFIVHAYSGSGSYALGISTP